MAEVLAFPLQVVGGRFQTVQQGSDDEIFQSARMSLLCPAGHRPLHPSYGRPSLEHTRAQVDRAGLLRASVLRDEPRIAELAASERFDALVNDTTIDLGIGD